MSVAEWSSCPELDRWRLSPHALPGPALLLLLQVTRGVSPAPEQAQVRSEDPVGTLGVWIVWDILVSGGGVPGDHRDPGGEGARLCRY